MAIKSLGAAPSAANDAATKAYVDIRDLTYLNTAQTSNFSATAGNYYQVDATSGAITVLLPASAAAGTMVGFRKADTSFNWVTFAPSGGGSIDAVGAPQLRGSDDSVVFVSDGSTHWSAILGYARGTSVAQAYLAMLRDPAGRAQVVDPSSGSDIATKNYTDAGDAAAVASANALTPAGVILAYAGSAAPTGFLLCQGQSLLRTDYPALFTAIGVAYGAVDGTHFTLPNLKGRVPVGLDSGQTEFDTLGETGGAKTHQHALTAAAVASHTHTSAAHVHTLSDAAQAQITVAAVANNGVLARRVTATSWTANFMTTTATGASSTTVSTTGAALRGSVDSTTPVPTGTASASGLTGSADAGSSLAPYLVLNYMIKT